MDKKILFSLLHEEADAADLRALIHQQQTGGLSQAGALVLAAIESSAAAMLTKRVVNSLTVERGPKGGAA